MNDRIEIQLAPNPLHGSIRPPGSKSITNRALVCAALAEGVSTLTGALDSEDTRVMIDSLARLGIRVQHADAGRTLRVHGCAGRIPANNADLYIANSGTSVRFLTSLVALGRGTYRLDGTPRMRERPIQDLLDGLAQLGVSGCSETGSGCPPVVVRGAGLRGGVANVRGDVSSQFLSGLLLVAPYADEQVELIVEGALVSTPYVLLTLEVMQAFGLTIDASDLRRIAVPQGRYTATEYPIEPDASAASYFFAAAAISGGEMTVDGLGRESLQGDIRFVDCLRQMGCEVRCEQFRTTVVGRPLRGIEVNMNAISDTVQTLAAVSLFAEGPTTIIGVGHIRHKETDRIGNLAIELRKLGALVDELPDGLRITPASLHGAEIETYDDHRMAMSLSLVGLRVPGVVILNPRCTEKTYPDFFRDLRSLTK